eukprot:scaffold117463_cov19-Tisochrysis_lutea.AAC.1
MDRMAYNCAFPSSCVHEGACLVACLSNHVEPGVLLFLQRAQAHDHSHEAMREHAHAHPHVAMRKPILPEVRLQELWMQDLSNNQAVHDSAAGWRGAAQKSVLPEVGLHEVWMQNRSNDQDCAITELGV